MNETERWQADAVRSARTRDLPSTATLDAILCGIEERVAAGAPDPLGDDPTQDVAATPPRGRKWQAWAAGGLLAAAATVVLALGLRSTLSGREAVPQTNAAAYDVQTTASGSEAIRRRLPAAKRAKVRTATHNTDTAVEVQAAGPEAPKGAVEASEPPPSPSPHTRAPTPRRKSPAPPQTNVAGEADALRKAHAAMEAGQLGKALAELRSYRKTFPHGVLEPEAAGLRVLIGCKREAEGAHSRARAFLRVHPKSVLRPRLESACENLEDGETDADPSRH